MIHAREDYDHFQDPKGKIPADEPVFLLRGQDQHAPATLRFWADAVEASGGDPDIVVHTRAQADAMEAWPVTKQPDL